MRLRQEFWAKRRAMKMRAFALTGAWVLASATLLIVGMSWWNWHIAQETIPLQSVSTAAGGPAKNTATAIPNPLPAAIRDAAENSQSDAASDATLVAANDAEDFTLLPGSLPQETGDAAVVRVRLQRGALGALGLPVNEERAGEWIQVDLFVGQDGQPQAVRMPR
jgi:cytoskeletal protein RodZ